MENMARSAKKGPFVDPSIMKKVEKVKASSRNVKLLKLGHEEV